VLRGCWRQGLQNEPGLRRLKKTERGHGHIERREYFVWSIENSLHWSLDVTFGEDKSRIRVGSAPEIACAFRRLALSILERDTFVKKCSIRGKLLQADACSLPVPLGNRYHWDMQGFDRITIDPAVCTGKPCIRGLRFPVSRILGLLAAGQHTEEILAAYPYLETADIRQALEYAAFLAEDENLELTR